MNKNFNEKNIENIKKWKEYLDKGYYGDAKEIVTTYNEIFDGYRQKQEYTTCGTCIRRYVIEMYNEYKKYIEDQKDTLKALETIDEFMSEPDEKPKKKRGRPKKND